MSLAVSRLSNRILFLNPVLVCTRRTAFSDILKETTNKLYDKIQIFCRGGVPRKEPPKFDPVWEELVKYTPRVMIPYYDRPFIKEKYLQLKAKRTMWQKNERYRELEKKIGGGVFHSGKNDHHNKY